jgi:hypothetical protein
MSADTHVRPEDRFARMRRVFRVWRGQRPFWGGMLTLLAGIPIMYIPYQNLTLGSLTIRMSTTAGAGSLIIGVLLVVLGITMWFQPHSRVFAGVAAILLALVSLVVSNFGAFLIGFLLGLIGGALCLSWAPGEPVRPSAPGASEPRAGDAGDTARVPAPGTGSALDDLSVTGAPSSPTTGADANNANGRHRAG